LTEPNKIEALGHDRASIFINAYTHGMSSKDICELMGWTTVRPPQRVHRQVKRLRDRGYDIPTRMPNQGGKAK
jgi:DNA-directed RNA polymerase specialized sigma24 family protein